MLLISHIIFHRPTSDFSLDFVKQLGTAASVHLLSVPLCFCALGSSLLMFAQLTQQLSWRGEELTFR